MKIALVSTPVRTRDIEFNICGMINAMEAVASCADIIVFGESALQGFDCLSWNFDVDKDVAVAIPESAIGKVQDAAREYGLAVCFGFIERSDDTLYSSQVFIGADGEIVNVFRRVSVGWKEFRKTDHHYQEGLHFEKFSYNGTAFAIGLCGDLWTDGRPEEMKALDADVVLWPVWCDYDPCEWNEIIKFEYAEQAALCGDRVLLINPYCDDPGVADVAAGGACYFNNGRIIAEIPSGKPAILMVEI